MFEAHLDNNPESISDSVVDYFYIYDMQKQLLCKTVTVIRKFHKFMVLSPQAFINLWSNPIRSQYLVKSQDHKFGSYNYQYINSPLGDNRVTAAYLAGKQCFVSQISAVFDGICPSFAVISQYMIYQMVLDSGAKIWIKIMDLRPEVKTEPIFTVCYREIYKLN